MADDWAALLAGVIILYNAYHIARPAIGELLDESLDEEVTAKVVALSAEVPEVAKVEKCLVRKMGIYYLVDLHIWVDKNLSVQQGHAIAHAVKDHIKNKLPQVYDVLIHVEPAAV